MRIFVEFSSYNQRRYGRPWIAVVTSWPVGGKPEIRWGSYLGDSRNGEGGEAEIEAEPCDIVRWGQKDNRGGNTEANWGIVQADGHTLSCDAKEARQAWENRHAVSAPNPLIGVTDADLLAEVTRRGLTL